jgi:hypothetical protein
MCGRTDYTFDVTVKDVSQVYVAVESLVANACKVNDMMRALLRASEGSRMACIISEDF